ncbi:MAG: HEAT repeat domain-containing protein [Candidatus Theseobacter exili]|nr:HEAT repeat domain-containing protein [Candidatus Theseobacter exili]
MTHLHAANALSTIFLNNKGSIEEKAMKRLNQKQTPEVVNMFLSVLKDNQKVDKHLYVLQSLYQIKESQALQVLVDALDDEDPYVRIIVETVLGKIKDGRAVPLLLNTLRTGHPAARERAAWILARTQQAPELIEALKSKNVDVRILAARMLGRKKNISSADALTLACKDKNKKVRKETGKALKKVTGSVYDKYYAKERRRARKKVSLRNRSDFSSARLAGDGKTGVVLHSLWVLG